MLSLINDILDMSKIESGSGTLNVSELNLAEVIDGINTIVRPQTRAKEQTFNIAVTANAFVDDMRQALESGMDAHIAKPVQIDNLKATIQQVLDKRANEI